MDDQIKEAVRARTDLVDLISGYTTLKGTGTKWKGLCPFHQEKTPSFQVDADKSLWRCYGQCGVGGDCFSFLMKADGLTFWEALKQLAEKAGVSLPARSGGPPTDAETDARQTAQKERDRIFSANALAVRFFRETFSRTPLARDYAIKRGLVHDTLETFQIGYAPDDWTGLANFLYQNKVAADDAFKAGLISPSKRDDGSYLDRFRGRLMFPIVDVQERVVGFGGRLLQNRDDSPKYLNSPETPVFSKSRVLYGLNKARRFIQENDTVVVVEGYMDAVACHQAGINWVVATLGTSLTDEHVRMVRRYAKNVVLSFDADEPGVKAALRAAELFAASGEDLRLRVLSLPPGEDPDTLIAGGRASDFLKAVRSALTVAEFHLKSLESRADTRTPAGRQALLRQALPIIASVPSIVEQDILVQRMARYHPINETNGLQAIDALRNEILQSQGSRQAVNNFTVKPNADTSYQQRFNEPSRPAGEAVEKVQARFKANQKSWSFERRPVEKADVEALPPVTSAWQEAERALLCGLLDDELFPVLRRVIGKHNGQSVSKLMAYDLNPDLWNRIWPLVAGGMLPSVAIHSIEGPTLADYITKVLVNENNAPISEPVLNDAIRGLVKRQKRQEMMQMRNELNYLEKKGEGDSATSDEILHSWRKNAQHVRGSSLEEEEA